jgi:hypothetical protein
MLALVIKVITVLGGLIGVAAQAKARGASNAETIAEVAAGVVAAGGALQMNPLRMHKPEAK